MSTQENKPDMALFWGCFIALITTAFAFITRAFLVNDPSLWPKTFGLDNVQAQELFGAGIWPFAISIIIFSLIIDRIGYKTAMWFSAICYAGYAVLALKAHGVITADPNAKKEAFNLLYWGSVVLGLGNGTVEAYINPVVATMFNKDKAKWLNILHAAWPGGLVIGGLLTLALGGYAHQDWRILVYIIAAPAVVYVAMLSRAVFPPNERVAAGTTYREMLAEFGILGAAIASYLITAQLAQVFAWSPTIQWSVFAVMVIGFGAYSRSLGRGILVFLCIVMIPLATTELGTDGAISGIMEKPMAAIGGNGLWVLIYTSAIMMVLRFFAGSIVSRISPLGLLAGSAVLAIALTLNAIGGIGMLAVGILGGPVIGAITEKTAETAIVTQTSAETYAKVSKEGSYVLGSYKAIDGEKVATLAKTDKATAEKITAAREGANQGALAKIAMFPMFMLACYIGLILWFRSRGGYKAEVIGAGGH